MWLSLWFDEFCEFWFVDVLIGFFYIYGWIWFCEFWRLFLIGDIYNRGI